MAVAVSPGAGARSPSTILVVDDDHLMRWSLEHQLADAGHVVLQAGSVKEALAALAGPSRVELVLLDVKLPDGDGLALLHRIKSASPACRVIMMSGESAPEAAAGALREGADAFVLKPFDLDHLLQVVGTALA
jgi:DNA-binding NtrC family response regulator